MYLLVFDAVCFFLCCGDHRDLPVLTHSFPSRRSSDLLQAVGALYGFFGLGLALYVASQGAGRLLWPLIANMTRLIIAAGGGWLALLLDGDVFHIFAALGLATVVFGVLNEAAVAGGSWFGRLSLPGRRRTACIPALISGLSWFLILVL